MHWSCGTSQTLSIPSRDESIYPLYGIVLSWISLRCVGLFPRDSIKWCHRFSLSWTWSVIMTHLPPYIFSAFFVQLKIPSSPAISGMSLHSVSIRRNHFRFETLVALCGMATRVSVILSLRVYDRVTTFSSISIAQKITVLFVIHLASPLEKFLNYMGSSLATSIWLLGRKFSYMDWKRWRVIWVLFFGPPWTTLIISSR